MRFAAFTGQLLWILDCVCLLALVDNAGMNIDMQISVQVPALNSLGYILRSGIVGSYSSGILCLKTRTVIHSKYNSLEKKNKI